MGFLVKSLSLGVFSALKFREGTNIQPEVSMTEVFLNPPGVMDVRAFG